ncbi:MULTISPECIES: bluetail domain-containing putative surface protein [unclassified Microcystis]|uniref:bluetail domain-containing putative surface protein n=1 Tax=Microcystis sp. LSC13-02 TaxID=1895004 RepID=UPI002B278978|nr:bluetail domain-containing putative surface protein [Microcystis sp. M065S2]
MSFSNCESPSFVAPQDSLPFPINGSTEGFQSSNDLLINITGFTASLPALGSIPVGNFFV